MLGGRFQLFQQTKRITLELSLQISTSRHPASGTEHFHVFRSCLAYILQNICPIPATGVKRDHFENCARVSFSALAFECWDKVSL